MITKRQISYEPAGTTHKFIIPKGVKVRPATNLPDKDKFWVCHWEGMDEKTESWHRSYGFLLEAKEVMKTEREITRLY